MYIRRPVLWHSRTSWGSFHECCGGQEAGVVKDELKLTKWAVYSNTHKSTFYAMSHSRFLLLTCAMFLYLCSCKKDKDDPTPPAGGGGNTGTLTANTVPFVQMTIDGTSVSYAEGSTYGSYTDNSGSIATPPASSTAHYTYITHPISDPDSPIFGASLGTFQFQGGSPTDTQFFGFFSTGSVDYGDTETYDDLVMITWWDGSGQEWSTFWSEDQTGSSFNIVETLQLPSSGTSSILVRANFTCKLYHDSENGQFRQVTNGTGVFRIENI